MINPLANQFIGMYPVSKTIRFELKPIGKTLEYVERDGIIDTDIARAENYKKMKQVIDEYHKDFIHRVLSNLELTGLGAYYNLYKKTSRTEKEEKDFLNIQKELRKEISEAFKNDPAYENLDKKTLITKELPEFYANDEEKADLISQFSKFTTYFTGFHKNRKNMYSEEKKNTAISYRLIDQNLPKYIDNIKVFEEAMVAISYAEMKSLEMELEKIFPCFDGVEDYFLIDGFNNVLTQKGIDVYNTILGGFTKENGEKVQGLNELVNLYNQKNKTSIPKFKALFKQILSDCENSSFILEPFASDKEVFNAIQDLYQKWADEFEESTENISVSELFHNLGKYDLSKIYISNDSSITAIAQEMYKNWSVIKDAVYLDYEDNHPIGRMSKEKYDEKRKKELKKIKNYPITYLRECVEKTQNSFVIEEYFRDKITETLDKIQKTYQTFLKINTQKYEKTASLKSNDEDILKIKELLDGFKELQQLIKPLAAGLNESEKDESFYGEFVRIWSFFDIVTPLYDKVRNYVTGKPYSTEKVKINFGSPTLLNGWDQNKEKDNLGIILLKDGNYYLGIINKKNAKCVEELPEAETDDTYKKMKYKLLPGPNKMLPKVFFSKSRINEFNPSKEILDIYKRGSHKKGENFNLEDCHKLIDFFKGSIEKHEDWSQFNFHFSDTADYTDINDFYKEVSQQGYRITFKDIDAAKINKLVDEGQLYLFQIYNKDFSEYSKGIPNLHTLYWKTLFSPENLKDVIYKLNGEAEVFFRRASIKKENIITHPANQPVMNKDPLNNKQSSLFSYDLIKDKRFTCDKFLLHVPITMNFKSEKEKDMNLKVNLAVREADNLHIIGIDRGERNLLYISVIDMNGKIVEQMSLNQILSYDKGHKLHKRDYQEMLKKREKENIASRQNWTTVNTIKEIKEGYLSQVVHIITSLMIKYNAIVVLEDLNFGFKRGRQKFERQVYQKFERRLIEKLNYYVDKQKNPQANGGLMNAYQLTSKFESFQSLGKQSGFLYYVPAWNTSKIDPTTGFANLLYTKYESVEKAKNFVRSMNKIWYDSSVGAYAFDLDYDQFTYKAKGTKTEWTIYTYGRRIYNFRNPEKNNEWDVKHINLTESFSKLLSDFNIPKDCDDLRPFLLDVNSADFFKRFMKIMSLTLQMRNSDESQGIDEIVSPVRNSKGKFYVSGSDKTLPLDADANGSYNIAKKGLWVVKKIQETPEEEMGKISFAISNKEWLAFAQENHL